MTDSQQPNWPEPAGQPSPGQPPNWPEAAGQPSPGQPPDPAAAGLTPGAYAYPTQHYSAAAYGQPVYPVAQPTNGMAIAALVCSLAGLATFVTAPVGAILGHVARKQIAQTGEQGDGMALAGIIVGWAVTGLYVCGCGLYFGALALVFGGAAVSGA